MQPTSSPFSLAVDVYFRFPKGQRDFTLRSREDKRVVTSPLGVRPHEYAEARKGRKVSNVLNAVVYDPAFVVGQKSRERVLATGQQSVHAFVRGWVRGVCPYGQEGADIARQICEENGHVFRPVTYRPTLAPFFFDTETGQEVTSAQACFMLCRDGRPSMFAKRPVYGTRNFVDFE